MTIKPSNRYAFQRYRTKRCTTAMLISFVILVIILTVTPIVYFTTTGKRGVGDFAHDNPAVSTQLSILLNTRRVSTLG